MLNPSKVLMMFDLFCFTATLIGLNEKPQGVSNDASRHRNVAATNVNKGISCCLQHRIYLVALAVVLLLMVILISVTVHFSSGSSDDIPKKHTLHPPPNGKVKYRSQNHWVSGLRTSSGIVNALKHSVSETGSVSVLRRVDSGRWTKSRNPVILNVIRHRLWTGLVWLRIGTGGELL
jgi:hypothetical protein